MFKKFIFFYVVLFLGTRASSNELNEEPLVYSSLWNRYENELVEKINRNLKNYYTNSTVVKAELRTIINNDMKWFENGINLDVVEKAASNGVRYKFISNELYRDKDCMFPTRCEGIEHFLLKLKNVGNYDIVVNTRDYPQVSSYADLKLPIFSFSKTADYIDIMYPTWSFWSGGPAIKLYPAGIGRWDKLRTSLVKTTHIWPWSKKKSKAFFRGSRTSNERDELIYLSRESPTLVDAAYTTNQGWKSEKDTLYADPADEVSFEDHCSYKYLFNFRGVAASFRYKHLFLCKSLVFHVGNEWIEFFYPLMKPWVHYVPIDSTYTRHDVSNIIKFFQNHDDLAEKIAVNGYNFVHEHLKMSKINWYWKTLLKRYIKLQKFNPTLDKSFLKIGFAL